MLDGTGTARIIDFGSTDVAGLVETSPPSGPQALGTPQYSAPEAFLGEPPAPAADQFALAVLAYELLAGRLPYGPELAQCRTRAQQLRLRYRSLADVRPDVPSWVDDALERALHPQPARRYADVAEFVFALQRPDPELRPRRSRPLIERDPVLFWKGVSFALGLGWLLAAGLRAAGH
jgi:serine/threonine protein kinase